MSATFGFQDVEPDEKPALVRAVFDRVARRYDLMNDLMSLGAHRLWKDAAAARLNPQPGEHVIDVAGGTGDLARRYARLGRAAAARRGGEPTRITVVDFDAAMVAAGRERGLDFDIDWVVGDAQRLPLPDACADAVSIGFGLRNVTDISRALTDMRRVLKPGGRFLCLEFSKVTAGPLRRVYDAYSFRLIPEIGRRVAGDAEAYQYLVESIRRFPDQKTLVRLMAEAGFGRVSIANMAGGVVALHQGWAI
ncbi:MAG TPA: class I SAM-dependent methyltransferase [Caulobacteraceae bacterium]|jgi:demethylmenaquinone methyltransferase/2-methoxy-6-polyprenyl-1,4-benzoquinol methylase